MKNIEEDFKGFLEKNMCGRNQIRNWESIEVDHTKRKGNHKDKKRDFRDYLRNSKSFNSDGKLQGIYAYYDDEKCLYIGKSKDIFLRLCTHFYASQGYSGHKKWIKFFKKYQKPLKVYYLRIDDTKNEPIGEALRIIVERILISFFEELPEFEKIYPSGK